MMNYLGTSNLVLTQSKTRDVVPGGAGGAMTPPDIVRSGIQRGFCSIFVQYLLDFSPTNVLVMTACLIPSMFVWVYCEYIIRFCYDSEN